MAIPEMERADNNIRWPRACFRRQRPRFRNRNVGHPAKNAN